MEVSDETLDVSPGRKAVVVAGPCTGLDRKESQSFHASPCSNDEGT